MPLTAELHIKQPPIPEWRDNRMYIQIQCGDLIFTRVLTRHAAQGLCEGLQRELARAADITPRELCMRLADEH